MIFTRWFKNPFYDHETASLVTEDYRRTFFSSMEGKRVLIHLLGNILNFFGEVHSEEDRILYNAGRQVMRNLGIWDIQNQESIMEALRKMDYQLKE